MSRSFLSFAMLFPMFMGCDAPDGELPEPPSYDLELSEQDMRAEGERIDDDRRPPLDLGVPHCREIEDEGFREGLRACGDAVRGCVDEAGDDRESRRGCVEEARECALAQGAFLLPKRPGCRQDRAHGAERAERPARVEGAEGERSERRGPGRRLRHIEVPEEAICVLPPRPRRARDAAEREE